MRAFFREHWRPLSLLSFLGIAHILVYRGVAIDDAFIFYRYGRSLAEGYGLTFNPGQYVEGYTSPLWTLLCGLLHLFPIRAPHPWMQVIGSVFALLSAFLMYFVGREIFQKEHLGWSLFPALLMVATPGWAHYAVSGMETSLHVCLLSGALLLWLSSGLSWRFGVVIGLAGICRPEIPYVFAVFVGLSWLRRFWDEDADWCWFKVVQTCAIFALFWGGWLIFRLDYYGEWLPNTYFAKSTPLLEGLRSGWTYTFNYLKATYFLSLVGLLILAALKRWKGVSIGLLWLLCCLPTLRLGSDWMPFYRFFFHYKAFELALWAYTLWAINDRFALESYLRPGFLVTLYLIVCPFFLTIPTFDNAPEMNKSGLAIQRRYKRLGLFLRKQKPHQIALLDAGAIAYYARVPILDLAGLTNRKIAKSPGQLHKKQFDPMYIFSQRPEWILLRTQGKPLPLGQVKHLKIRSPKGKTVIVSLANEPFLPPRMMFPVERALYLHPVFHKAYDYVQSRTIRKHDGETSYAQHLFRLKKK